MSEINHPTRSNRNRWLAGRIVVLLAAALAWWQWPAPAQPASEGARGPGGGSLSGPGGRPGGFRGMGMGGPVPVRLATAALGDYAGELKALGTVTAFNTVSVLPRVDGQLVKVLFEEGQLVKAGQMLAQIDPRPYRAALDKAEGDLAERRAELKNAEPSATISAS
jgi:multidrug efflux system membrane fusion protein